MNSFHEVAQSLGYNGEKDWLKATTGASGSVQDLWNRQLAMFNGSVTDKQMKALSYLTTDRGTLQDRINSAFGSNGPSFAYFPADQGDSVCSSVPLKGGSAFSFSRASSSWCFSSTGELVSVASGSPRFDYNPSTLTPRGLLIESGRTNSLRNNTMVGAVAGSPGTYPTFWATAMPVDGLARTVVGTGTESGIDYVDIRISGTTTGARVGVGFVTFESPTQVAALSGQVWAASAFCTLVGGTLNNVSNVCLAVVEHNGAGTFVTQTRTFFTPAAGNLRSARYSSVRTLTDATTAFVKPALEIDYASGVAIDFTVRIGLPQLENCGGTGAFATSPIKTSTVAVARSSDAPVFSSLNPWFNSTEGTIVAGFEVASDSSVSIFPVVLSLNDGTFNNSIHLFSRSIDDTIRGGVKDGGVTQVDAIGGATTYSSGGQRIALAYKANDFATSALGGAVSTDSSGSIPTVTQMTVGYNPAGLSVLNGWLRFIVYYPQRLSDSALPILTA